MEHLSIVFGNKNSLTSRIFRISDQVSSSIDLPKGDEDYNNMVKQSHHLITTCEKAAMAKGGIKVLLNVKKYTKRYVLWLHVHVFFILRCLFFHLVLKQVFKLLISLPNKKNNCISMYKYKQT